MIPPELDASASLRLAEQHLARAIAELEDKSLPRAIGEIDASIISLNDARVLLDAVRMEKAS